MIGARIGVSYFPKFDSDKTLNKVLVNTDKQLIEMLLLNRIDVFIGQQEVVNYELSLHDNAKKIMPAKYKKNVTENGFMAMSKSSKNLHLKDKIEQHLEKLVETGVLDKIIESYR